MLHRIIGYLFRLQEYLIKINSRNASTYEKKEKYTFLFKKREMHTGKSI